MWGGGSVYPRTSSRASSSSSMGAKPSKRWWMIPCALMTKDHSVLGRFHSRTVDDTRARVRSPWISVGVVEEVDMDEVRLALVLVLEVAEDVDLGAADGVGAEGGACHDYDGGQAGPHGVGDADLVEVGVLQRAGGQLFRYRALPASCCRLVAELRRWRALLSAPGHGSAARRGSVFAFSSSTAMSKPQSPGAPNCICAA